MPKYLYCTTASSCKQSTERSRFVTICFITLLETHKKGVQVKEDKVRLVKKAVQEKSKVLSQLQKQYSNEIQKLQVSSKPVSSLN